MQAYACVRACVCGCVCVFASVSECACSRVCLCVCLCAGVYFREMEWLDDEVYLDQGKKPLWYVSWDVVYESVCIEDCVYCWNTAELGPRIGSTVPYFPYWPFSSTNNFHFHLPLPSFTYYTGLFSAPSIHPFIIHLSPIPSSYFFIPHYLLHPTFLSNPLVTSPTKSFSCIHRTIQLIFEVLYTSLEIPWSNYFSSSV